MRKVLSVVLIVVALSACKNKSNEAALGAVNKTLQTANEDIVDDNKLLYAYMHERLQDPQTKVLAGIWEPKELVIKKAVEDINKDVDSLRKSLKKHQKDYKVISGDGADKLFNSFTEYNKQVMLLLDVIEHSEDSVRKVKVKKDMKEKNLVGVSGFAKMKDSIKVILESTQSSVKGFAAIQDHLLALTMLNKLQNDVLLTENALLTYCNNSSTYKTHEVTVFQPLAILDRSYVKAGQYIEVNAGVGAFKVSATTVVKINGVNVSINSNGVASCSFITTGKPGRYQVRLSFEFEKQDGTQAIVSKDLKYTILK